MNYVCINKNLYLVEQQIKNPFYSPTQAKKEPTNHIWLIDRSGSMYSLLSSLIKDVIARAKQIPNGDTITLGWFSGEGQKNFVLKGFKVTEAQDYTLLEKALNQINSTVGLTCFSEILHDTDTVIKDLTIFSSNFALCLFTDGFPVVSSYNKEIESIFSAVKKLESKVTASLLVGYGDYYNKTLMSDMAERIGGSLTHAENLNKFSISLEGFIKGVESVKKYFVELEHKVSKESIVFNINDKNVNIYSVDHKNQIGLSCSNNVTESVYILTKESPKGTASDIEKDENLLKAAYAASYILTQKTKTDQAIDVLGYIGDKEMVDSVTNAFTNAEYGRAEEKMKDAVADNKKRFLSGKVKNYVPPVDAFCLLDLIDVLSEDTEAFFYPRHEAFEYKRIGKPAITEEGYPKFDDDKASNAPFSNLVWNSSQLNLSLQTNIKGSIELPKEHKTFGFSNPYPTFQFRTYTFVKDGVLNVTKVPASMSEKSFSLLKEKGLVEGTWEKEKIFIVNLNVIPIVNRKIAEGKTSATELCKLLLKEERAKAALKAIKWFKNRDLPEKEVTAETAETFMEKQQAFLESVGINTKSGAFSPPSKLAESTDHYFAKAFDIKIKGLSSLPKVEVVAEKMKEKKKLTSGDTLVSAGVSLYEANNVFMMNEKDKKSWFDITIKALNTEIKGIRRIIQETKFSVLLCKKWFQEFTSREDNKLTLEGYEFTISLSEKKVEI